MNILFWTLLLIIVYSYIIYPLLLYIISKVIKIFKKNVKKEVENNYEPEVTLFIAAFNEIDFIERKIKNSFSLDYPKEKLHHVWITDGSNDGTQDALQKYDNINVYHNNERKGKIGALNRGIQFVKTPITIFSDANSMLNKNAVRIIANEFYNPKVGCVAGEKRISINNKDNAVNSGEGIYWIYESFIKKYESRVNSTLGAAGELFAIRTNLYTEVEDDTILDDFIISMRIALKGYKIKYSPESFAIEDASINIQEELKRKIRIAYGGFQAISRLSGLINPMKNPILSFQFISHKLLRWTLVPFSIFLIFFTNLFIVLNSNGNDLYFILLFLQLVFYLFVIIGAIFQSKKINFKLLFAPYYLFLMNLSEIIGLFRFIGKKQSVNWERSKRK